MPRGGPSCMGANISAEAELSVLVGRAAVFPRAIGALLAILIAFFIAMPVRAQGVEQFYSGKVITLYIGFSAGGGYDLYGRLVAHHIGRHIPGRPNVVPVNMEGAGSLKLMNWLYNAAPKDGTALGTVNHGVPFVPLVGERQFARFDAREFTWIGSANDEVSVCVAWKRTNITRFDQLYEKEFIVGSTGPGADDFDFPKLITGIFGVRIRSVSGYAGGNDINFAMEQGEVDGRCGWTWSSVKSTRAQWLEEGLINVLLQFGLHKHPDLPDVPLIMDLARNDEEREILRLIMLRGVFGRPFMAPPGIPADRATALQDAFDTMVTDPDFLAEAEQLRAEIAPISGANLQQLLTEAYATPEHIVEQARMMLK